MYDDLTIGDLPDPKQEVTKEILNDVLDIVSAQASTNAGAAELKAILSNPYFQVCMHELLQVSLYIVV